MPKRKKSHLQRNIGITVVAILIILATVVVALQYSPRQMATPVSSSGLPLTVGDIFTYNLTGSAVLGSSDVQIPTEFLQYNDTEYYQVTITSINGTQVFLNDVWEFKNGTQVTSPQIIDLSTGSNVDPTQFCYVYPANLSVSDPLYPDGNSGLIVNSTSTLRFGTSSRTTNYWSTEDEYVDTSDQTGNTLRSDFISVYFDKETGILDKLTRIEFFTNPQIELTINWQLESSNAWNVQ